MQRLVIRAGNSLAERCSSVSGLEIREVASNPLAAGLAARGSRMAHAHDGRTVHSALLANLLFGIPYIITRRVVAPQRRSWLRSLAYRRALRVVGVSPAVVEAMRERHPAIRAEVIPDASAGFRVADEAVAEIRAGRAGKFLIGHIGALDHSHKGQSTIIAAARLAAAARPDWHFLMCGDGRDEQRFRDEIGALTNVELTGWVENVGDYLASFDLFVYPSLHEALGSTLLDAMQAGLPVVASRVGGIPDIVADGINGLLVEPENPQELFNALAAIADDEPLRNEIRARNRKRAAAFSSGSMAESYEAIYRCTA